MTWMRRAPLTAGVALAVAVVALVIVLVEGRAPGPSSASGADTAVVREGRFRDVVVLDGSIAAPPRFPLTLTSPTSEYEWAVPDGRRVRRGTVVFLERVPVPTSPVGDLQAGVAAAGERVASERIAARQAASVARRAVRHAATADERRDAKAELHRVIAASAQRVSTAVQQQAELVAQSSVPQTRTIAHRAPTDGIVRRGGGPGEAAGVVGTLEGTEYSVRAALDPLLLYRFHGSPRRASVTIPGGPPSFRCRDVAVHFRSDPPVGATPDIPASSSAAPAAALTCVVPSDVRVFPGLRAVVRLNASTLRHALLVPARAVRPDGPTRGTVTISRAGRWVERHVSLGPSDGETVVVDEGLRPGQTVLLDADSASPAA